MPGGGGRTRKRRVGGFGDALNLLLGRAWATNKTNQGGARLFADTNTTQSKAERLQHDDDVNAGVYSAFEEWGLVIPDLLSPSQPHDLLWTGPRMSRRSKCLGVRSKT